MLWVPGQGIFVICVDFSLLSLLGRAGKPLARALGLQSSACDSRWGAGTGRELGVLTATSLVPEVASHQGQIAHLGCLGLPVTIRVRKVQPAKERRPGLSWGWGGACLPAAPLSSQVGPGPGLRLPVRGRLATTVSHRINVSLGKNYQIWGHREHGKPQAIRPPPFDC